MLNKKLWCMAGGLCCCLLTACGDAQVVVPGNLSIISMQPGQGAINVSTKEFSVAFSAGVPVLDTEALADYFTLESTDPVGTAKDVVTLQAKYAQPDGTDEAANTCYKFVNLVADRELIADTHYTFTVKEGLTSCVEDVGQLPVTVSVQFRTAAEEE